MEEFKQRFIRLALKKNALQFGEFQLKSGRISPYFFNSGKFQDAESISELGICYATALQNSGLTFDILFGPAYKGIPLVTATAIALYQEFGIQANYCCNRKEIKQHGEGGVTFGAPLTGQVVIVDDVISAGTSINLSTDIIRTAGAKLTGAIVALDRQERGQINQTAIAEIEQKKQITVVSLITLTDLIEYLKDSGLFTEEVKKVNIYYNQYGI